jgi:cytochrome P450
MLTRRVNACIFLLLFDFRNISRDESVYVEPHKFNPDRFLESVDELTAKRRDPENFVFGFGRRVCIWGNVLTLVIY